MPLPILLFYVRRPDFTPEQFQSYMEEKHIPLLKAAMGPHWAASYTLRYVVRVESGVGDRLGATTSSTGRAPGDAPVVLLGSPEDLGWDVVGEMVFRDELHLQQAMAMMESPEGQSAKDDEENFTIPDQMKVVIIGESRVQ
jgi:hypothetical protein